MLSIQRIERISLYAAVHKIKYQGLGALQGVEQLPEKTLAQELLSLPSLGIIALDDGYDYLFIVQKFPDRYLNVILAHYRKSLRTSIMLSL